LPGSFHRLFQRSPFLWDLRPFKSSCLLLSAFLPPFLIFFFGHFSFFLYLSARRLLSFSFFSPFPTFGPLSIIMDDRLSPPYLRSSLSPTLLVFFKGGFNPPVSFYSSPSTVPFLVSVFLAFAASCRVPRSFAVSLRPHFPVKPLSFTYYRRHPPGALFFQLSFFAHSFSCLIP